MKRFSMHFDVHTLAQIVFFNNFVSCRSLFKKNPCTSRGPKIGKITLENCNVHNFDNQVDVVVGALMKLDNPN
jgi:hypothetical protein